MADQQEMVGSILAPAMAVADATPQPWSVFKNIAVYALKTVVLLIAFGLAGYALGRLIEAVPRIGLLPSINPHIANSIGMALTGLLATYLLARRTGPQTFGSVAGTWSRMNWMDAAVLVAVVDLTFNTGLTVLPHLSLETHYTGHGSVSAIAETLKSVPLFLLVLEMVIIGPIFEEYLFREHLLSRLYANGVSFWLAATTSSAIFALVHLYPWRFTLTSFVFGLMLCALRRRSGYLAPSIVAHGLLNATVVALAYWGVQI